MSRLPCTPLVLAVLAAPSFAHADAPTSPIYHGTEAGPCDWPSVVQIEDSCSGTLVHPEVVIYAGHCGPDYDVVHFGEGGDNLGKSAATDFCVTRDGIGDGLDYAVCKLKEPVLDVPIVPILMGCEVEALQIGGTVTFIGFGEAESPLPYGIKRVAHSTIEAFDHGEIFVRSDDMMDTCYGDSGGPVMVQLADGTWRVFGITSYGVDDCGTGTWYSMMHTDLGWFEDQTGVDITPCHTRDGVWDATAGCGMFPKDPGTGVGSWAEGCGVGPVGEMSTTCGPAFGAEADTTPPIATVTDPLTGVAYKAVDSLPLTITGSARDAADKPEGWGVTSVSLVFNTKPIADSERSVPPYTWNVKLPSGQYLIQIDAVDNAGNHGLSPPVAIGVNQDPPEVPPPSDDTTGGESSSDTGELPTSGADSSSSEPASDDSNDASSSDSGDAPATGEGGGCGCRETAPTSAGLLTLAALLVRRRRRR